MTTPKSLRETSNSEPQSSQLADEEVLEGRPDVVGMRDVNTVLPVRYDLRILRSLRRIIRCIDLYSRQLSATNQITTPQLVCLLEVVHQGPLTATAISRAVHLSPSTVVGILDRLEEKGWVTRERTREDRRVIRISATPKGVQLSQQVPSPLQSTLAQALNALPELEQVTIALSLERIVALMEAQEIDAAPILATGPINPSGP